VIALARDGALPVTGPRAVEADFPGWHVWTSDKGRWWATRTGAGALQECHAGDLPMTVDADDEGQMRAVLSADGQP
jgi:hypothetical protein